MASGETSRMLKMEDAPMETGSTTPIRSKRIPRDEMISLLRKRCTSLVDDEHSLCSVASRLHIACGGFSQWKFHELKERYDWIVKRRPGITRAELEDLANRWQLARQTVRETPLPCDTQLLEGQHKTCEGWDHFSDRDLERFWTELTGETVEVAPAT
jgi:hypothetical protein